MTSAIAPRSPARLVALLLLFLAIPSAAGADRDAADQAPEVWRSETVAGNATLIVVVEKIRSESGRIHVGVWNRAEDFTDSDKRVAGTNGPVTGPVTRLSIKGMAPGSYAVAVFHDENDNGSFDQTWIGLPDEGLGFSNGAWISLMGAPSFGAAAFKLRPPATETAIRLRY